jgi:hypothetical protein
MGSWGTGPFDNDSACDMVIGFTTPIKKVLHGRAGSYGYDEARAAVQFIALTHGKDILGGASMLDALELLRRMRADKEWIAGSKIPRRLVAALNREIKQVQGIIKRCKSCREALKTYAPPVTPPREERVRFIKFVGNGKPRGLRKRRGRSRRVPISAKAKRALKAR